MTLAVNIAINFIGRFLSIGLLLLFLPLFLNLLGPEEYGLLTIYALLQLVLSVLESGISTTVNKNIAALTNSGENFQEQATILRTYELIIALIAIFLLSLSPLIGNLSSKHWLEGVSLSPEIISLSVTLMTVSIAIRLPSLVYLSTLLGLQLHLYPNIIQMVSVIFRTLIAYFYMKHNNSGVETYFYIAIFDSIFVLLCSAFFAWKKIRFSFLQAKHNFSIITRELHFISLVALNTIVTTFTTQLDRLILSFSVPLNIIGIYGAAATLSGGIVSISYPIAVAAFPRLTQLSANNNISELKITYLQLFRLVSLLLTPICMTIFFFSDTIVYVYFQNPEQSELLTKILSWLSIFALCSTFIPLVTVLAQSTGRVKELSYFNMAFLLFLTLFLLPTSILGTVSTVAFIMAFCYFLFSMLLVGYMSAIIFDAKILISVFKEMLVFPFFILCLGTTVLLIFPDFKDSLIASASFLLISYAIAVALNIQVAHSFMKRIRVHIKNK